MFDKYQSLARDAFSTGDRVLAEGYLQHAEHYFRILSADKEAQQQRDNARGRGNRDASQETPAKESNNSERSTGQPPEAVDDVSKPGAEQPSIPLEEAKSSAEEKPEDAPARGRKPRRSRKSESDNVSEANAADQASAAD